MSNHSTLEYIHDDCGVTVRVRPKNTVRSDFWVKDLCYINFNTDGVTFHSGYMSMSMMQEIVRNLHELTKQHDIYLKQLEEGKDENI